jgi:DNA polymerase-1
MPYAPATRDAYRLFHQGTLALSRMEAIGMPINLPKMQANRDEIGQKIREGEAELRKHNIYKTQQKIFGKETDLGSRDQLSHVLFNHMKLKGAKRTKNGKYKLDDEVLRVLNLDYADDFLALQKLRKLKGTYLDALCNLAVNGRVHGSMNLHKVKSFRGSAEDPNLNNLPSRNKMVTRYIKGCICPPEGWYIVESDYSALEVHIAACYHKDPTMISNLETGFDMHTSISKQCYRYDDDFITANKPLAKELRTAAKSDAVFSWMYGNYYIDVALRLWKTAIQKGLLPHLAASGIKRLGVEYDVESAKWIEHSGPDAFVTHIKSVEDDFWNNRYAVYGQWRKDWYRAYQQKGFFHTLTGFGWYGVERRNFIINAPVQGDAFHCLLQAIIDIQSEIARRKMRSRTFLEIHDSLLSLVPADEVHDYIEMATDIMTTKLKAKWPWICLDLKVEHEISSVSWADKQPYTGRLT